MKTTFKDKCKNLVSKGKQNIIVLLALVVLVLIFTLLNKNFVDKYNIISMTQSLAPYAILALGVTFVIATGGIDLSIGTVCIASAVVAGKLFMSGMPLWATIPVMIAIGTTFGLINGLLVAKLKIPAFIATLGTMMFSRGLSAIIVSVPNIFFPSGTWFNAAFSNANGIPTGFFWVIGFTLLCAYLMYKNVIGRYILSIG
ncbi:MAG: ABC transporter permease, partial [Oscillospiraceae bacterium]